MPTLDVVVNLDLDGVTIPGFPIRRTIEVSELQSFGPVPRRLGDTEFRSLPLEELLGASVLAIRPTKRVVVRLAGQSDHGIPINRNGLLFVMNGKLCTGSVAKKQAEVQGNDTSTAYIRGFAAK